MLQDMKQALAEAYPYRIELHAHTSIASPCGRATPEETVQLYVDAGFDGLVITNHFSPAAFGDISKEELVGLHITAYERACKAAEGTGLKIYLCAEIRFHENGNDYLLYGVNKEILESVYDYFPKGLAAFREAVSLPDSLLIQAHPFRDNCAPADGRLLDGVEVFNMHPNHNPRSALAAKFAKENNLSLRIAGTDFHHVKPGYIAAAALRCKEMPADSFALAALLRTEDYIFEIGDHFVF